MSLVGASDNGCTPLSSREAGSWSAEVWLLRLAACWGWPCLRVMYVYGGRSARTVANSRFAKDVVLCVFCRTRSADVDPNHLALSRAFLSVIPTLSDGLEVGGMEKSGSFSDSQRYFFAAVLTRLRKMGLVTGWSVA